jgi:hypothetical protein
VLGGPDGKPAVEVHRGGSRVAYISRSERAARERLAFAGLEGHAYVGPCDNAEMVDLMTGLLEDDPRTLMFLVGDPAVIDSAWDVAYHLAQHAGLNDRVARLTEMFRRAIAQDLDCHDE